MGHRSNQPQWPIKAKLTSKLVALHASAAICIQPVLLNKVIAATERHVVLSSAWQGGRRTKGPGAEVGVFLITTLIPRVDVWIGDRFLKFVGDDRRHCVRTRVAVWTNRLRRARRWAT